MKKTQRYFDCDVCEFSAASAAGLSAHKRFNHRVTSSKGTFDKTKNGWKKKMTPFTCVHCQREFDTLRGIRIHQTQMHPNAGPFETTIKIPANEDRNIEGKWKKVVGNDCNSKGQITAVPDAPQRNQDNVEAMRYANAATKPWYEMLLIEFEGACRASESMMNDDAFKAIKDINPSIYAATVMKTFSDRRTKFLRILQILDEKRLKYDAYERELLS